jgi:hypothetical protein
LAAAADFLKASFAEVGYEVKQQAYTIDKQTYYNLEDEYCWLLKCNLLQAQH